MTHSHQTQNLINHTDIISSHKLSPAPTDLFVLTNVETQGGGRHVGTPINITHMYKAMHSRPETIEELGIIRSNWQFKKIYFPLKNPSHHHSQGPGAKMPN